MYIKDVTVFSVIKHRRKHYGTLKNWTIKEDEIIRKYLVTEGKIIHRLTDRTYEQCIARNYFLGESTTLSNKGWDDYEDSVFLKYYEFEGDDIEYRLKNRSRLSIEKHARELGLIK